ncbi:MAG: HprK-related kinase B [Myxococcota bacterium]
MSSEGRSASIASLAASLAERLPTAHARYFAFDGWRLELRSNAAALVETVGTYLELFAAPPGPCDVTVSAYETAAPDLGLSYFDWKRGAGKVGKKEQCADLEDGWVVRKVRTGMHFLLSPTHKVAVGPCTANFNQVVNFINATLVSHRLAQGWTLCHAAGVALGNRGIGIAGTSGAGKSTLALHAMNEGLSFVSNDRLLIQADGAARMTGIPKHPRINPGTALNNPTLKDIVPVERRAALEAMPIGELWALEEKYDADIGSLYDGRWTTATDLVGFMLLDWRHDYEGPTQIERIDLAARSDLWPALFKHPGPLHVAANGRRAENTVDVAPEPYLHALAGVPVFEIRGRVDFPAAVNHCMGVLRA